MKHVLFSGIQPTGRLHIGNYLGALRNFVDLQNTGDYQCYFSIVDLHSLTENFDPKAKKQQILNLAADFLAAGIDPNQSVLFQQSQVPAHSELGWILNTITPIGELERMTQFKDKSERQQENVNVGLFTYPTLMVADILLYDTNVVPVGDDQSQHLELTRTLVRKFNKKFGDTFVEPKMLLTKTPRVMSLKDPRKKMSKSQPESCLFLDDSPKEIAQKIGHAVTDSDAKISYNPDKKPGLSNLIELYAAFSHMEPKLVAEEFAGTNYSKLKSALATVIADHFTEFREKKKELLAKPKKLAEIVEEGSAAAARVADKKMIEVKRRVGIEI